jgi:hypothetical protein
MALPWSGQWIRSNRSHIKENQKIQNKMNDLYFKYVCEDDVEMTTPDGIKIKCEKLIIDHKKEKQDFDDEKSIKDIKLTSKSYHSIWRQPPPPRNQYVTFPR